MNKKGFVASYVVDFYAYLIFALILVIFFVVVFLSASPVENPLKVEKAQVNLATVLISAMKTPTSSSVTPAEMISGNDVVHKKEFQETIASALKVAYPPKNGIEHYWVNTYFSEKIPENPCEGSLTDFSYEKIEGFSSSNVVRESARTAVFTALDIPLKNRISRAVVVLCVGGHHFR